MSISGKQTINVGLPNESTGSDSLYTAFNKTQYNFDTLFACASPYNTFTPGPGIDIVSNVGAGTVAFTNTGVTNIIAGTNIVVSNANGNVTISSTAGNGNGGGTVTSVALVPSARLTVSGSPVVSSGVINIDLAASGVLPGTYANPTMTVDAYGRVTSATGGSVSGTVTSIGLTPGSGIQINGGPITSNGNITVTNTGVLRINAGAGIALSSGNGNVTISTTSVGGTVTSVGVSSSQLVVTNSPVVSAGTIAINLPSSATFAGTVTASNLAGTLTTAAQPNITSVGNLTSLAVTGNVTAGNLLGIFANGNSSVRIPAANGNVNISAVGNANVFVVTGTGANIAGTLNATGNANVGNIGAASGVFTTVASTTAISAAGSENLLTGGAANLAVTSSYFTTLAPSTATLAAGTAGLIKTFMLVADGGNMVITVTNAGWKSSGTGTMTFDDIGDGCTLQYINSKWYCIGNNGVVFA